MPLPANPGADDSSSPRELFPRTRAERVALARQQFFEEGVRPSGLVGEAVLQSWMRCTRAHSDSQRPVAFDPVTPSRLHATLGRNRELLDAARAELQTMESSLAGTDARVLLTDAQGVIVHATHHPLAAAQPVLNRTARVGVNIAERMVGTTAPGIVACTGQAVTVNGAEHYFSVLHEMHCAAAPIRDVQGRLAAVLDVSVESRPFSFGAAQLVALFATTIENRLLVAQSQGWLLLRFQASPALLGTPLEALAGIGPDGCVAWLNGAAERLVGPLLDDAPRGVEPMFGVDLATLLRLSRSDAAQPLRLANGLGVWLQARLQAGDGLDFRHAVGFVTAADEPHIRPAAEPVPGAGASDAPAAVDDRDGSLRGHGRKLIEDTLAAHGGNISQAARQLRVSRGTLYRRLKHWQHDDDSGASGD
ncbi:helix-turn-helix domain-containing protein [Variovorax sp. OV329]|uniref:helix-turn-helix domain-containing protein n=1 Tax=Variovorax sp. OV329 TaxID=1882825 RepID=UPI0008E11E7B|nr:helix-turn-helix domain-containing protein [Variovorax sp. OV329]SFM99772.1 regulatory protein, Fis family [Variovorax sp. OV329]